MNKFLLFLFSLICFHSEAKIVEHLEALPYQVDSVLENTSLGKKRAQVIVMIKTTGFIKGEKIQYGIDGSSLADNLDKNLSFNFKLNAGARILQFYPPEKIGLEEITTSKIKFKAGTTTYLSLRFRRVEQQIMHVRKPVIYLYPEIETTVSVTVKPAGELSFTYPKYEDQWNCTAFPSGELKLEGKSYNYLFWEAEQQIDNEKLRASASVRITKNDFVPFLERSLDQFGFTSKEKADFITFWAPMMIRHEATEIRFILNEACDQFAELEISPIPENILRFYMIWNPTNADTIDSTESLDIPEQIRNGFTVLEWGGLEIPPSNLNLAITVD
ncbi:MAG: hypothetical protein AB8B56_04060 [Crocinitomicaceae bacterium]